MNRSVALAIAIGLGLLACGHGSGSAARSVPSPIVNVDPPADVQPARDAGTPIALADAGPSAPRATRSEVTFRLPWVVLGRSLVDTKTAQRVRSLPFGEIRFADDGQHFALFDGRELVLGAARDESSDFVVPLALEDLSRLTLATDGSSALLLDRDGATFVIDARARTHALLARGGAANVPYPRHAMAPDGRRVAWVDEDAAHVRDLDTAKTRDVRAGGKTARRSELAGDTWVALFEDELVVVRLSSGAELARRTKVDDFVLGDDGKTLAWEDASASLQTVVFFDAEHAREGRRVALVDDDQSTAKPRFRGVCGGGRFTLAYPTSIKGAMLSVHRDCSIIDDATIDLASGAVLGWSSATPAEDVAEEQRRTTTCKRAHATCDPPDSVAWVGPRRALMREKSGALAVFDVASGRRLAVLASSNDQEMSSDVAIAPDGRTIAGIDGKAARLWDAATGKVLWSDLMVSTSPSAGSAP